MNLKHTELEIIFAGIIYVVYTHVFISKIYAINDWSLFYSLIHSFLASIILIYLFRVGQRTIERNSESLVFVTFLMICIYNFSSSNKYIIPYLYPGFVDNSFIRLLGSVYVDFIILVAILIWDRFNVKHINRKQKNYNLYSGNTFTGLITAVLYALFALNNTIFKIPILYIANDTLRSFANTFLCSISLLTIIVELQARKNCFFNIVLMSVVIVVEIIISINTGKRHELIIPVVTILSYMYIFKKLKIPFARRLIAWCPLVIIIGTQLLFEISGRYVNQGYWYIREFVYRFDLSDFALTVSASEFKGLSSLVEGVIAAIPGVSIDNLSYQGVMYGAGLSVIEDYNDTIFSIGSELCGLAGMAIVPIIIILLLEVMDWKLKTSRLTGVRFSRLLIVFEYTIAETTWAMLFLYTRNALLAVIIGFVVLTLIIRKDKRNFKYQ